MRRLATLGLTPTRLLIVVAGFISVYCGFSIVGNQLHQYQLDREKAQLEAHIQTEKDRYARLNALNTWMQTDDFVVAMARQQGMIRRGDRLILVSGPTPTPSVGSVREWWERYFAP